ncbi:hypothetical protein [Streptomyces sp. NPDC055681]
MSSARKSLAVTLVGIFSRYALSGHWAQSVLCSDAASPPAPTH